MAIELAKEQTSVYNLSIPEPRKVKLLPIELEAEITEEDKDNMRQRLQRLSPLDASRMMVAMFVIDNSFFPRYEKMHGEHLPTAFHKQLELIAVEGAQKAIYGEHFRPAMFFNEVWEIEKYLIHPTIARLTSADEGIITMSKQLDMLLKFKLLFPEDYGGNFKDISNLVASLKKTITENLPDQLIMFSLELAANTKLLYGANFLEQEQLDQLFSRGIEWSRKLKGEHRWGDFAETASFLKILMAEKTEITADGLKVFMPGKYLEDNTDLPMPAERSF